MIVITGGTGQLGRLTVEALLETLPAENLAVVARDPEKAADLTALGVQVRHGDYDAPGTLVPALQGADKLLFISANGPDPLRVRQHQAVVAAARQAGVGQIIYTSVIDADTSPLQLAEVHRLTEHAIRDAGIPYTFLRNPMYTENYTGPLPRFIEAGALISNAADGIMSTAPRADLARAAAHVLLSDQHKGAVYELTGSHQWTFAQLAELASDVSGRPVPYKVLPDDAFGSFLAGAGLPQFLVDRVVDITAHARDGHLARVTGDLQKLIGRPATRLEDSVRAALSAD